MGESRPSTSGPLIATAHPYNPSERYPSGSEGNDEFAQAKAIQIRQVGSIDDHRQEVWIKGSDLEFMRTVLKSRRALGKEALPKDLQEEARLWSRAELPVCGQSDIVREICRGLVNESG